MPHGIVSAIAATSHPNINILIVDDDPIFVHALRLSFQSKGHTLEVAASVEEAVELVKKIPVALALVDIQLSGESGFTFLERCKGINPDLKVIMLTASRDINFPINALRLGAADYLLKPVDFEELWGKIDQLLKLSTSLNDGIPDESIWIQLGLVGVSPRLAEVRMHVEMAARTNLNVLITGETGTGKELCANAVHLLSGRSAGPFVPVNCAALGDGLFQAEIFGYKKGSFTGADETRKGYIEVAEGGTLFMDEIGEVPLLAQVKLLRAIETGEFNPVGETRAKKANVRYVVATNRNLMEEVASGRFREDLYYRLNVMEIHLPPLRERREDIPPLVEHYIGQLSRGLHKPVKRASPALMGALMNYSWPGNVRQLLNMLVRAIALSGQEILETSDFPHLAETGRCVRVKRDELDIEAKNAISGMEKEEIRVVLLQANGDIITAAKMLNLNRATLYRKIKKYGFDLGQFRNPRQRGLTM